MFCGTQIRGIRVPNIHDRYDPPPLSVVFGQVTSVIWTLSIVVSVYYNHIILRNGLSEVERRDGEPVVVDSVST